MTTIISRALTPFITVRSSRFCGTAGISRHCTDKEGYKSLSYDKLTAVLIEAVKSLKTENDSLKAENNQLKTTQARIFSRLDALEKSQK